MRYPRRLSGLLFAGAMFVAAAVVPGAAAHASTGYSYTMRLSPASATLQAGDSTRTTISFHASRDLYGTRVDLSVSGLPTGVTASFSPPAPRIGDTSFLALTAAPSSATGASAITVTAITKGADPIGTSTTFDLTVGVQ